MKWIITYKEKAEGVITFSWRSWDHVGEVFTRLWCVVRMLDRQVRGDWLPRSGSDDVVIIHTQRESPKGVITLFRGIEDPILITQSLVSR